MFKLKDKKGREYNVVSKTVYQEMLNSGKYVKVTKETKPEEPKQEENKEK